MGATDVKAKFRIPGFVPSLIMASLHKNLSRNPLTSWAAAHPYAPCAFFCVVLNSNSLHTAG